MRKYILFILGTLFLLVSFQPVDKTKVPIKQVQGLQDSLNLKLTAAQANAIYVKIADLVTPTSLNLDTLVISTKATAPTMPAGTNTTDVATTANVQSELTALKVPFTIQVEGSAIASPSDGTTYYEGGIFAQAPTSLYGNRYITIPCNCTLFAYSANILATGAASNETYSIYVRVNDSNDYELGSGFNVHTTGGFSRMFSSSSLNLSLLAGDRIAIKIVTPTWTTNPTSLIHSFVLFFKTGKI